MLYAKWGATSLCGGEDAFDRLETLKAELEKINPIITGAYQSQLELMIHDAVFTVLTSLNRNCKA